MASYLLSLEAPDTMNRNCSYIHCGKEYLPKTSRQKFCSQSCCRADKRMKKGKWVYTGESINCKGCEKSFIKNTAQKVYCTAECAKSHIEKAYYQNNKEKWFSPEAKQKRVENSPYKKYKKETCELCGFVPLHPCQLDVDHIDGKHENHDPSNLQTLCANCHRIKTFLNRDGAYRKSNIINHDSSIKLRIA